MAIPIADSMITGKIDRVARATGLTMNAVVELALDLWLSEMAGWSDQTDHMAARMAQLDQIN
jgi:antitoxin VapB